MHLRQIVQVKTVGFKSSKCLADMDEKSCQLDLMKFSLGLLKKNHRKKILIPNFLSRAKQWIRA